MQDNMKLIAARLGEIREVCGYSVEEIAARLGLSPLEYKEYEESGNDVPIGALYELANIYGVDIMEILTGKSPKLSNYCVVKQGLRKGVERFPGYHYESLAYKFKRRIMEPLMVTVEPGGEELSPNMHPGQEFNYVVEGAVMVVIGDEELILEAGDCIYFDPTIPHRQKAIDKPAKFLTVIAE